MTTCLGKGYIFGFHERLSVYGSYVFFMYASFPFDFEGGMWDMIVLIPVHCFSFYFPIRPLCIILYPKKTVPPKRSY